MRSIAARFVWRVGSVAAGVVSLILIKVQQSCGFWKVPQKHSSLSLGEPVTDTRSNHEDVQHRSLSHSDLVGSAPNDMINKAFFWPSCLHRSLHFWIQKLEHLLLIEANFISHANEMRKFYAKKTEDPTCLMLHQLRQH